MSLFSSESAWLCLAATAVLGAILVCRCKNAEQLWSREVCLAGLWGGAWLLHLPLFWSVLLFSLSCFLLHMYSPDQELLPVAQKAVLVTGSDSGFGHALVKHLDKLGFTVFAGVLDEKGSGAEELRKSCSERLSVLQMDVTKPEQIKDVHSKVVEKIKDKGLWAVVNNAGILHLPVDGELIPMTDYKKCMAVNYFGVVEVTKAFLPLLRKSKGRLVNVSSMGGTVPFQCFAAYGSTKAAVVMFSSVMRQELSKWGIKVIVIQPGAFRTNLTGTNDRWEKMEKDITDQLPQDVQEDYGQEYIPFVWKTYFRIMIKASNPDITPVLRDIQQAISAKSPSAFYAPGKLTFLWICFACFSPTSLLDYIMQKVFFYGCVPRALSMSNKAA